MHYYISCYFYDQEEHPMRLKLKEEFRERYPWVTILERKGRPGFQDYSMINDFLEYEDKSNIESITLIDSDLFLQDNFRTLVEAEIEKGHDIIHGSNVACEYNGGKKFDEMNSMTPETQGYSGFIWTFSKKFLERINYTFPDGFTAGGLDYLFALLFIKQREESTFIDLLGINAYGYMFCQFFNKTKGMKAITLNHSVIHCWHGPRSQRLTEFKFYNYICQDSPSGQLINFIMNNREKGMPTPKIPWKKPVGPNKIIALLDYIKLEFF